MKKLIMAALMLSSLCLGVTKASELKTISFDELEWGHLNPARGDASPKAADIWGNRKADGATGFLVKFKNGFFSPPHIHNVTYRGVVIKGRVHNDDPDAVRMWMTAGSFWTQPAGESHITEAIGDENIAYIEIDSGPYHVHGHEEAFDNGEQPINVDQSNLVWLNAAYIEWLTESVGKAEIAFLWGEHKVGKLNGTLLKLPVGFSGEFKSNASVLHAVVIKGSIGIYNTGDRMLAPGSYFGLKSQQVTSISSDTHDETILYIRADGRYSLTQK